MGGSAFTLWPLCYWGQLIIILSGLLTSYRQKVFTIVIWMHECVSILLTLLLESANIRQHAHGSKSPQVSRPNGPQYLACHFMLHSLHLDCPFAVFPLPPLSIYLYSAASRPVAFPFVTFPCVACRPLKAWHFHWLTHMAQLSKHMAIDARTCMGMQDDLCCINTEKMGLKCQTQSYTTRENSRLTGIKKASQTLVAVFWFWHLFKGYGILHETATIDESPNLRIIFKALFSQSESCDNHITPG